MSSGDYFTFRNEGSIYIIKSFEWIVNEKTPKFGVKFDIEFTITFDIEMAPLVSSEWESVLWSC